MNIVKYGKIIDVILSLEDLKKYIKNKDFKDYTEITRERALNIINSPDMTMSELYKLIQKLFNYGDKNQTIFSIKYWLYRGWSKYDANKKVSDIQKNNNSKYQDKLKHGDIISNFSKEYLLNQYNDDNIVNEILSNKAKNAGLKGARKRRENPELYIGSHDTSIEYYLKKGLSEEEAKAALKERQATFTLEKCIKRHGLEEGTKIFNERQEKWQNTLNSKPQEEIDDINRSKGITPENMIRKYGEEDGIIKYNNWLLTRTFIASGEFPGDLYYIHFYNDEIEFWKIGITKLRVEGGRFAHKRIFKEKHNLEYKILFIKKYNTYKECYEKEQSILKTYSSNRLIIEYNGFKTTEAFDINIFKDYI